VLAFGAEKRDCSVMNANSKFKSATAKAAKTKLPLLGKNVRYFIRIKGDRSSFVATGYSRYDQRWMQKANGKLKGEIYGVVQAREHIKELRVHEYNGRKPYANSNFEIVREETVERLAGTSSGKRF
jgi:hypothetical protein